MWLERTLATGLILAGSACSPGSPEAAPDFELKDSSGRQVRLSSYKGKVVLLNFWTTWCSPCRFEEPWFMEFEQKYRDKGFAILAVSMDDEGWSVVSPYVKERKLNYRILLGDRQIDRLFPGMEAWPTNYLIDRAGRIVWSHTGMASKQEMIEAIERLM